MKQKHNSVVSKTKQMLKNRNSPDNFRDLYCLFYMEFCTLNNPMNSKCYDPVVHGIISIFYRQYGPL